MKTPKPIRWPKNGKQARDFAIMEATLAQQRLLSIITGNMDHRDEYRTIGRAIEGLSRVINTLSSVEPEQEQGGNA